MVELPPCSFRAIERTWHRSVDWVCLAAAGESLTALGGAEKVCGKCPVPAVFSTARRTCARLIAVKRFGEQQDETVYTCVLLSRFRPGYSAPRADMCSPGFCEHWRQRERFDPPPERTRVIAEVLRLLQADATIWPIKPLPIALAEAMESQWWWPIAQRMGRLRRPKR